MGLLKWPFFNASIDIMNNTPGVDMFIRVPEKGAVEAPLASGGRAKIEAPNPGTISVGGTDAAGVPVPPHSLSAALMTYIGPPEPANAALVTDIVQLLAQWTPKSTFTYSEFAGGTQAFFYLVVSTETARPLLLVSRVYDPYGDDPVNPLRAPALAAKAGWYYNEALKLVWEHTAANGVRPGNTVPVPIGFVAMDGKPKAAAALANIRDTSATTNTSSSSSSSSGDCTSSTVVSTCSNGGYIAAIVVMVLALIATVVLGVLYGLARNGIVY